MATTIASRKAKGRTLQNKIVEQLLIAFPELTSDDIVSVPASVNGRDIMLSQEAQLKIPYSIECKNQEKLSIWEALKQASTNAGVLEPVLVFKRNRSKIYAVVELDEFIKLVKQNGK